MANMYVLAVINNYGMAHLSESVKQTNILKCSQTLLKACVTTTTTSIDITKWISSTCSHSILPDCSKANKMGFPVKPQC